jgi:hypothetical protein
MEGGHVLGELPVVDTSAWIEYDCATGSDGDQA